MRELAKTALISTRSDDFTHDILATVTEYAGFVDANMLCFLWPDEFANKRICFISGAKHESIFTCFDSSMGSNSNSLSLTSDVIIHCDGSHFTLLQPLQPMDIHEFLRLARSASHVVLYPEIRPATRGSSVKNVIDGILA